MILLKNEVTIEKPKADVYAFLSDFTNIPRWNYYVLNVQLLEEGDTRVYLQQRKTDSQKFVVVKANQPDTMSIKTIENSNPGFRRTFTFEGDQKRCVVYDEFEVDLGHPKLVQRLFKRKMQKAVETNLNKLKELLESGSTVLQDGRISKIG